MGKNCRTAWCVISKWILKTVEDSLIKEEDGAVKTRGDIEKENIDIRKEISEMQEKLRRETIIRNNLEKEIWKYRAEPFIAISSSKKRRNYDIKLVNLIRNTKGVDGKIRYLDNDEILSRLGVKLTEMEAVKAISNQLSRLERYGFIYG